MEALFLQTTAFNQSLNNWNVSNVTNMSMMFAFCSSFNQPLNNWNVSNVTTIDHMFMNASSFNQDLNNWDVSNVTDMRYLFEGASSFNQPLANWDVSSVNKMTSMFKQASSFNQPLNNWNISTQNLVQFLDNSGMDINNYDNFLSHLVTLGLQQGILGANGLEYCNFSTRDYIEKNLGWAVKGDYPFLNCNSIVGEITYDENNNGCDPADQGVSGFMINANDGTNDLKTYSSNGSYTLGTIGTNFTVSVINYPSYYSVSPASQSVTFTSSSTEVIDFCVTANQSIEDLNITLLPISEARPGFEADYQLVVENLGTQTIPNATVTVDFDDAMQSFVSASVTPTSTTANQLTFDVNNLHPLTNQKIDFTQQTFQPPTVNGDDILSFTATVTPNTNDNTPTDNVFNFDQVVVNSYDPNDKQVLQGEEIYEEETDEYLDYLIRFQNTGTASAINVRILDTLHPKLDYSTLKPVSASHNYHIEITDENQVEFIFDGINLPDENTNEPASHGFVAYKIKPKNDVTVGDFIEGDARIYFDFNAPIITNMTSTEIIDNIILPPTVDFIGDKTNIDKDVAVSFTDLSSNSPTSWEWTFDGGTPNTSSQQNPTVTYQQEGTYSVTLKATNTGGSNILTKSNYIEVKQLSVKTELNKQITIYPNPTKNILNIEIKNHQEIEKIKVYNIEGVTLQIIQENRKQLNVENLSAGIYFIKITTDRGVVTKRLIKE
ncbi:BspA family leucine-rich repeat surface protein [Mesonia maritima]